jgi:MFS superfamily sulfate permease-like transporter
VVVTVVVVVVVTTVVVGVCFGIHLALGVAILPKISRKL